ncbi:MAG: hypothetical protein PHR28_12545 [candidate division Zixibacteria bacterium]|nr:hypothetical protein [candidate division Zixibacteria bacterium]
MKRNVLSVFMLTLLVAGISLLIIAGCGKAKEETPEVTPADTTMQAPPPTTPAVTQTPKTEPARQEVAQKPKEPPVPKVTKLTIPDNTELQVTLTDTVQTNTNQVGDIFGGTIAQPVMVGDREVIPQGARVKCQITNLVKGGALKTKPEIAFVITNIIMPDGQDYGVTVDAVADTGRSHTNREAAMIGGGTAAGAVVGGILGKKKGAIIGAIAGAAAGTGAAAATGRENLVYPAGQTVSFTLQEPLTVSLPKK